MASNIHEFEMGLKEFADSIPEQVGVIHRAAMLEGLKGVVQMSPVKTGRFRANWQTTVDTPAVGDLEETANIAEARGAPVIAAIQPYSVSWITNNLPYAEALENGHSSQAPAGMLNVTFQRLKGWIGRQR
jgi:hypothetical protein